MILNFFPENALGDGPENSRIRVKITLKNEKFNYGGIKLIFENSNYRLNSTVRGFLIYKTVSG